MTYRCDTCGHQPDPEDFIEGGTMDMDGGVGPMPYAPCPRCRGDLYDLNDLAAWDDLCRLAARALGYGHSAGRAAGLLSDFLKAEKERVPRS